MLDCLNYFGNKVVGRYKTVESNIKNRSNSFYDSFLDLIEDTVKTILTSEDVGYDGRTCGEILREPDAINFFRHKIQIDKDAFDKITDYIKKINEHKHHNEKYVNIDTVINYTRAYYNFVKPYLVSKNIELFDYNEQYFRSIYGITIDRSNQLDNVSQKVDEIANVTNLKLDEHSLRMDSLELRLDALSTEYTKYKNQVTPVAKCSVTNKLSDKDILHRFLTTSKKSLRWFGTTSEFRKSKNLATFSHILLLAIGLFSTILTSISCGIYSTFTLFENVWLIFGTLYLTYALKSKHVYESGTLARNNSYKYTQDKFGLWTPGKEKAVFKVFRWIAAISTVANIVFIWTNATNTSWIATIFEVLMLGTIIFSFVMNVALFSQYSIIYFEGKNISDNKPVTLVWDQMLKKFVALEDYKKKMPFMFD